MSEQKTQAGTVLVFKEGVSKEEAQKRLEALRDILDLGYFLSGMPQVQEFNPDWGGPVWYVP
jgi:hypothetical protein